MTFRRAGPIESSQTTADTIIAALQARLRRASEGFERINEQNPPGGQYGPPPDWHLYTSLSALVELLVDAGMLDAKAYEIKALMNQVDMLEKSLRVAAEDFRTKTGIIVNVGPAGRPQG